jgi:alpha-tubulin suppressor-like RCC1 family protein
MHCLALSNMGECYSWGINNYGQLGLGKDKNIIVGNPTNIKFDIFDTDGHKYITEQKPIFYEIATGANSSLALGMFNNRQILYFWGDGAGILNDISSQAQSTYPLPISGVENISNIFARYNSIGIFCWDKTKKINLLYVHGIQKFGIDAGIGIYDKPKPVIVNYFKDKNINVLSVNFSNNCMSVIGRSKDGNLEVYLRGELTFKLFGFKEYKSKFMKLEKEWEKNVVAVSPQEKCVFFLLNNGIVKRIYMRAKKVCEKDFKIEGYDEELEKLNIEDINKIKFNSFLDENFIVFYQKREKKDEEKKEEKKE